MCLGSEFLSVASLSWSGMSSVCWLVCWSSGCVYLGKNRWRRGRRCHLGGKCNLALHRSRTTNLPRSRHRYHSPLLLLCTCKQQSKSQSGRGHQRGSSHLSPTLTLAPPPPHCRHRLRGARHRSDRPSASCGRGWAARTLSEICRSLSRNEDPGRSCAMQRAQSEKKCVLQYPDGHTAVASEPQYGSGASPPGCPPLIHAVISNTPSSMTIQQSSL